MAFPAETFPNPEAARTYVNQYIVPNGMNLINGTEMNNVLNAILTFIEQSPLNWQTAQIVTGPTAYTASIPVIILAGTAPTTLQWNDNIYNQYLFINTINASIPLANGYVYYDTNGNQITAIPPLERVSIMKATNGNWFQAADFGNVIPPANTYFGRLDFVVGNTGSPMNAGDTVLTIAQAKIAANSASVTASGTPLYIGRTNEFSYTIVYGALDTVITFNQPVSSEQDISVTYAYSL